MNFVPDTTNVFFGGIDFNLAGNGGTDCLKFLSIKRRIFETIITVFLCYWCIAYGYRRIVIPTQTAISKKDIGGKRVLLIALCLTFGIEIGFKFATRSLIFILNPCHVTTILQIFLLASPPSALATKIFRIHLNFLNGAVLALLFPVTNTRLLSFETDTYYIQHILMLIIPYYLLRLGGAYSLEELNDFSWQALSYGILLLYHFLVLQLIGIFTTVNLNSMLCPAVSDPFYGPNYRLAAVIHQMLMVPLVAKGYRVIASYLLTRFSFTKVKDKLEADLVLYRNTSIICVNSLNTFHQRATGDKRSKTE